MSDIQFADLHLSTQMLAALEKIGYIHPTPVQQSAIPMVFTGRDLMVQSQTGTGKTAAYGIPLLDSINPKAKGVKALVLAPTRELAKQVADELTSIGANQRIQSVAVYGGASMDKQIAEMRFAHIVAGTPGRILDHLKRQNLRLNQLQTLVLDEADEMLSMGFARELSQIMEYVPEKRQTLLFSATIPEDIKRLAKRYLTEPEFLSLVEENVAADDVEHHYYMVNGVSRPRDLVQVIEYEEPESAIIFTNTRKDSELVCRQLMRMGYDAEYLNSDLPQREREEIMKRIKEKSLRFLVATDIAARGIDITELSHVINYVLPESPEVYIHRTGRTGRAGHKGVAISLIGPREIGVYYYLKRIYNVALQERQVPTQAEIEVRRDERKTEALVSEILNLAGPVPNDPELHAQAMRILEREDAPELVMSLLHAMRQPKATKTTSFGGPLSEVPKPDFIAPGALPQTLEGVAERVRVVQGEFRGLPKAARKAEEPERTEIIKEVPKAIDPPKEESKSEVVAPKETKTSSDLTNVFLNVGRLDGFSRPVLRETLCDLAGLLPEDLEELDVRARHTYIHVAPEYVQDLIEAVNGEILNGKTLRIEVARDEP